MDEHVEKKKSPTNEVPDSSRRTFIKNTGMVTGGVVGGALLGGLIGNPFAVKETTAPATTEKIDFSKAMQFFTRKEDFIALASATEVIFPEDEHGPGAIELGAPYFIDKQLASPWGRNADDFRKRPFKDGTTPLNRGEVMLKGVRKLNEVSQKNHQDSFDSLTEDEQIAILQDFESGNIEMNLVSSATFFAMLRQLTIEGCYSDPMYGGNKNMEGWKMKEFPGVIMAHTDVVESKEFVYKEPRSLSQHT